MIFTVLFRNPKKYHNPNSRTRYLSLFIKSNKNNVRTDLFPQGENNALHKIPSFLVWKFCGLFVITRSQRVNGDKE